MIERTEPGDTGRVATTWTGDSPARVSVAVLPEVCSRHNSPSRAWSISGVVSSGAQKGNVGIVLAVEEADHAVAATLAAASVLPTYSASSNQLDRTVLLHVLPQRGTAPDVAVLQHAAEAVRMAANLTDRPPNDLGCDAFVASAQDVAKRTGSEITVLRREELRAQGLGGLLGVGKAAEQEPALIVLDHAPQGATRSVVWVGKGIVYDTGGLSLKSKTGMPGMKSDMGGAAAVMSAFEAAVQIGVPHRLTAILCVAENAVGPGAIRPDDILKMFSGRTVEVNNTDAEGRLVLADGVAWAAQHRAPTELVDVATLTGAQAVSTGKRHAGLYCNDDGLELRAVHAGRRVGDLVHPLPFSPELFRREFNSAIADMRNSVKDRSNAQTSCAGQFIYNHLTAAGYEGPWLHVDMAGPSVRRNRGTGYGVGLLLALIGAV